MREFVGTSCENCLFRVNSESGEQTGCSVGILKKFAERGEVGMEEGKNSFTIVGRRCPLSVLKDSPLSKLPLDEILFELSRSNEPTFKVCLIVKPDSTPESIDEALAAIKGQTKQADAVSILCHNSITHKFDLEPGWGRRTNFPVKKFEHETWFYLYEEGRADLQRNAWAQYIVCCFPQQPLQPNYLQDIRDRVIEDLEPIYTTEQPYSYSPFVFDFLVGMKLVQEDEGKTPEFSIQESIDELGIEVSKP